MIAKSYIENNLRGINHLYAKTQSAPKALFYSKLATLELCGWIEMSMDEIVLRMARRILRNQSHLAHFQTVVKRVYGFKYEEHFRHMIVNLIGLNGVAKMEMKVSPALFQPMCGALNALKPYRDLRAHEYIKGVTVSLDAPSVTISKFRVIYPGLVDVDGVLRGIR